MNYYDPSDNDMPVYEKGVDLTLDYNVLMNMEELESKAQILAVKA